MDEEIPKPKFPWLRLARWSVAVLIAALIVAHAMWGSIAEQGVNRRVKALRDAGEPILPADFTPPTVSDENNAAIDIEAAAAMIDEKDPVWEAYSRENILLPLRPRERDAVVAAMRKFGPALDRVDQGRNKPAIEVKLNLTSPVLYNLQLTNLNNIRGLCSFEGGDALMQHERGDDAVALRRLDRILFIARYPEKSPTLIGQLVAIGCTALAADRVVRVAPGLKIGTEPGSASPQDVRALIDQLLDDRVPRQSFTNGFRGERMVELDAIQGMANGLPVSLGVEPATALHPMKRYALRPVFYRNARTMLDYLNSMIKAMDEPNWPAVKSKMPAYEPSASVLDALSNIMLPSLSHVTEAYFRSVTERRLAATALAIRWYAVEHDGKPPQALDQLVPWYLPALPVDPLASDGRALAYLPRRDDPIVYSVGPDGIDDGGSEAAMASRGNRPPRSEWEMRDRVLHLKQQPRPADEEQN